MIKNRLRPWLWLPASLSHSLAPWFLKIHGQFNPYKTYSWQSREWRGLKFANPLGLAAGMDKNGSQVGDWWSLGAGFVEVGTIVPEPQGPNPGDIIDRDNSIEAIWNRMGFPSLGAEVFKKNIAPFAKQHHTPIFINIGKNRETPVEFAARDYARLVRELYVFADVFVINISSPNTKGLRALLTSQYLHDFLGPIVRQRDELGRKPLLLKVSPDLTDQELEFCLLESLKLKIDGWVLTNTTLSRPETSHFPAEGGVSGRPLADLSKKNLRRALEILGPQREDRLIISVGGVMSAEDVFERLEMGADLVQTYAALIFRGPFFFRQVAKSHLQGPV